MPDKKRSARIDWDDLRILVELSREGSLSASARSLGITHATVARRVARLEESLGRTLFFREGSRFLLTEAGKRVLGLAKPMAQNAEAILRAASGLQNEMNGPVRITTTEAVGSYIVAPALAAVRKRYPEIELELRVSEVNVNLARRDADIAIRLAPPQPDSGLHGVKLSDQPYNLYGARRYLEATPEEDREFIGYTAEFNAWQEARTLEALRRGRRIGMRSNHLSSRIVMTRLGMGLSLLPIEMAEQWPELVRVSKGPPPMRREIYLLVHEDLKDVPRFKACVAVLREAIRASYIKGG